MKPGDLVRVVHHDPHGPYPTTPVWDVQGTPTGHALHGETALLVRKELRRGGVGIFSAGWTGDAEIVHPRLGPVIIEQAYLEVVSEAG